MAFPGRSPVSRPPTRQQLDELDALMQRMLELPVEPGEESIRPEPSSEVESLPEYVSDAVPERVVPSAAQQDAATTVASGSGLSWQLIPPSIAAAPPPRDAEMVEPSQEGDEVIVVSWWLRPTFWLNRRFDRAAGCLGTIGRSLSSSSSRTALGWIGVLLLVAAAGWVALDALGWTW
jgi:hypothetical protein